MARRRCSTWTLLFTYGKQDVVDEDCSHVERVKKEITEAEWAHKVKLNNHDKGS